LVSWYTKVTMYTMQDITSVLLDLENYSPEMPQGQMLSVMKQLKPLLSDYIFDWDEGAGENWALLDNQNGTLLAICTIKPLVLVAGSISSGVLDILRNLDIKVIIEQSWDAEEITFDSLQFQVGTPKWLTRAEGLLQSDGGFMSLHDFWWSTV